MKITGIIGAMESEVEQLISLMNIERTENIASMKFYSGTLERQKVVVVRSGIGKVNAGICTQILIDRFQVTRIINSGIAGSLNEAIDIGDIVISNEVVYHDVDATVFGYEPGEVPQLGTKTFPADEELIHLAQSAGESANPDIRTIIGKIVTGDAFISSRSKKEQIKKEFGGDCIEMEGAAIGHTAYLNKVPFVIFRAISDKADDSAVVSYQDFERAAIVHVVQLVLEFLKISSPE